MSKHENRRKLHVSQLAKQMNKHDENSETETTEDSGLAEQYRVIKDDLMKLREDLNRGYDMAKDAVDKKTIISELMKLRANF